MRADSGSLQGAVFQIAVTSSRVACRPEQAGHASFGPIGSEQVSWEPLSISLTSANTSHLGGLLRPGKCSCVCAPILYAARLLCSYGNTTRRDSFSLCVVGNSLLRWFMGALIRGKQTERRREFPTGMLHNSALLSGERVKSLNFGWLSSVHPHLA